MHFLIRPNSLGRIVIFIYMCPNPLEKICLF